jgi:hypothetical protein
MLPYPATYTSVGRKTAAEEENRRRVVASVVASVDIHVSPMIGANQQKDCKPWWNALR